MYVKTNADELIWCVYNKELHHVMLLWLWNHWVYGIMDIQISFGLDSYITSFTCVQDRIILLIYHIKKIEIAL